MRFQGILSAWNPDAGYGTIRALNGGDEVFVGLAAFPTDGEGPRLDEPLSFEIVSNRDGRKQAVNLKRMPRSQPSAAALREPTAAVRARAQQAQRKRRLGQAAGAAIAVMLVLGGVRCWQPLDKSIDAAVMKR